MNRTTWILAVAVAVLTVVGLAGSHRSVGYVRDEGIYFEASRRYAAWTARLVRAPSDAMRRPVRDKAFAINHEHPALMKTLGGISAAALASGPDASKGMPEGAAMRLPAQIIAGLGVMLLFVAGVRRGGVWAGLLAAAWFITLPRVWFHAGLHAFDVPVTVAILAVVLAYRASLTHRGWGLALGPLLGVAIAVKHNALFVGPLLALHYYGSLALAHWREGRPVRWSQLLPLPMCGMAIASPLVAWALWPWLWHDTIDRVTAYFAFHRQHNWYNMEFLGVNYNQPPMPVSYPWVMTWATVPTVLLLLAVIGIGLAVVGDLRLSTPDTATAQRPTFFSPLPVDWNRHDGALLLIMAAFPLVLISLPTTPIFGGTKHFFPAYPFLALGAATAWGWLWKRAAIGRRKRWLQPVALAACLGPGIIATVDGHPYNLSQYAPFAGGPRGAANMGLARGFWGHAVPALFPTVHEALPRGGAVYLHDLHDAAREQYEREGVWRPEDRSAAIPQADAGLLFYERHMTTYEVQLWGAMGTTSPSGMIVLDDVPLTSLYVSDR